MEAIPRRKEARIRTNRQLKNISNSLMKNITFQKQYKHDFNINHYMKVKLFFSLSIKRKKKSLLQRH